MTKHKQGPLVSSYSPNRVLFSWFKTCKFYEIWIFKEVQSCAWKKVFSWCEKWPWESGAWCVTSRYMWSLVRNVWALLSSHWSSSCSLGLWLVQGVTTHSVYLAAGVVRTLCCITFYMCAAPLEAQTGIIHYFVSFLDFSDICTCAQWSPAPGLAACLSGDQAGLSISSPTSKGPPVSWWTMKGAGPRWSESLYPKVWLKRE